MTNLIYDTLTVVIPAFNEGKTVAKVIKEVLSLKEVAELILVDDGSTDDTSTKIKKFETDPRFVYIKHLRNRGKGPALKTGIEKAQNEIILLLDADLKNITAQKIRKIFLPVLKDEVDVSRASFNLTRGRVTEIAVKPMMRILFPDIYSDQPISGQVCAHKYFLESVDMVSSWGVDIAILLDAIQAGQRIVEIDIGTLEHKARTDKEKAEMAQQVLETMIKKAGLIQHKYKLVVFTLDHTLVQGNTLQHIFGKLKLQQELKDLQDSLATEKISFKEFIKKFARLLKGRKEEEIVNICQNVPLVKYASEVINALKKRKYQVAIISSNFSLIAVPIAKRLGIDIVDCIYLEALHGKLTGDVTTKSIERWSSPNLEESFEKAFIRIIQRAKVKPSQTIMVANSPKCIPLFLKTGLSIAFRPEDPMLKEIADKTISILPEILAITE